MGADQLRKFFDEASRDTLDRWYLEHTILVRVRILRLSKQLKRRMEIPEPPEEVINETVRRVLDERHGYGWSGSEPFDDFFEGCLYRTLNGYLSRKRAADKRYAELTGADLQPAERDKRMIASMHFPQYEAICTKDREKIIANLTTGRRIRGNMIKYLSKMLIYASEKWQPKDIAGDLGTKEGNLPSYRFRIYRLIDDSNND